MHGSFLVTLNIVFLVTLLAVYKSFWVTLDVTTRGHRICIFWIYRVVSVFLADSQSQQSFTECLEYCPKISSVGASLLPPSSQRDWLTRSLNARYPDQTAGVSNLQFGTAVIRESDDFEAHKLTGSKRYMQDE